MKRAIIGLVDSQPQAESIVQMLRAQGFTNNELSVLFPDKRGTRDFAHEQHTKAPEGAVAGAGAGGVLGGTLGLLAGIGAIAIPGVGPLIAAGPIMALLSGVAAGATVGGIGGALVGLGIPEIEAKRYDGKIRGGNILIAVHTEDSAAQKRAEQVFKSAGAHDVGVTREAAAPKNART